MTRKSKLTLSGVAAVLLAAGGASTALAAGAGDDDAIDTAITGPELASASAAALAHTGQGRVTETEVGDEESRYEVEVTIDDGSEVDVQLDEGFRVVSQEAESADEAGNDD